MNVESNKSLKAFNTFGINALAKYFSEILSVNDFKEILADKRFKSEKKLILGGGSNILFSKNFDGLVIKNSIPGISIISESENEIILKVSAGVVWHELVLWCIERNYAGIENLS